MYLLNYYSAFDFFQTIEIPAFLLVLNQNMHVYLDHWMLRMVFVLFFLALHQNEFDSIVFANSEWFVGIEPLL